MNATEARQRSANAALNLEVERQLEDVLKRIRTAADAGLYRVVIAGDRLHPQVTARLLALGYEESYNATTCGHTISWALFTNSALAEPVASAEYVIRRTTRMAATWADGAPRKGLPDETYIDWWVGGVCFTNTLTNQCTRLTLDLAKSICALMIKYRQTNETYQVWTAEVDGVPIPAGCAWPVPGGGAT